MNPASSPPRRTRILVVDDHPFFREGIAAWIARQPELEYAGFADSAATAMQAIEQTAPDLVLLDLQLREGSGLDVLAACKGGNSRPRIIVVSQKDEAVFGERAIRAGAHGYIMKEEASETMLEAIRTVLGGGLHISSATRQRLLKEQPTGAAGSNDKTHALYHRERQVLLGLGRGLSTKEIAAEMKISPKTVESYRESLKKKLGFSNSLQLIRFATMWQHEHRDPTE